MFKKMVKSTYPPRLWALVGYPGSGKSTFATQMADLWRAAVARRLADVAA